MNEFCVSGTIRRSRAKEPSLATGVLDVGRGENAWEQVLQDSVRAEKLARSVFKLAARLATFDSCK